MARDKEKASATRLKRDRNVLTQMQMVIHITEMELRNELITYCTIRRSHSTYLELNPESYFAFRKTPNCSELCHDYRLHCIYPVSTHLRAITIPRLPVSKITILFEKKESFNSGNGKHFRGKLGSAESLKTFDRCFIFQVHFGSVLQHLSLFYTSGSGNGGCLCK